MERICVAIRVKPTSRQEVSSGAQWKVVANTISLHSAFGTPIKGQSYTFGKPQQSFKVECCASV